MKKTGVCLLCLLAIFFIFGCAHSDIEENQSAHYDKYKDEGEFWGELPYSLDFENKAGAQTVAIDEKLALKIGNAVIASVYGEEVLKDTMFIVSEISAKNVFIVSRVPKEVEVLGGSYSVAISKTDGAIVKVWPGE